MISFMRIDLEPIFITLPLDLVLLPIVVLYVALDHGALVSISTALIDSHISSLYMHRVLACMSSGKAPLLCSASVFGSARLRTMGRLLTSSKENPTLVSSEKAPSNGSSGNGSRGAEKADSAFPALSIDSLQMSRTTSNLWRINLNRPKSLNAFNHEQMQAMLQFFAQHAAAEPNTAPVLITSTGERAFCAGGDVVSIYNTNGDKGVFASQVFGTEYSMNVAMSKHRSDIATVWKGITMGGGIALGVFGNIRIVTDDSLLAMPECAIGFVPDVGASYFLTQICKDRFVGAFLGMFGHRFNATDAIKFGLATHYVEKSKLAATVQEIESTGSIRDVLAKYASVPKMEGTISPSLVDEIRSVFHGNMGRAVCSRSQFIERINDSEEIPQLSKIYDSARIKQSALSMAVWLEMCNYGSLCNSLIASIRKEFTVATVLSGINNEEFIEGIGAVLVKKTGVPNFKFRDLGQVSDGDVNIIFNAELPRELKLNLKV